LEKNDGATENQGKKRRLRGSLVPLEVMLAGGKSAGKGKGGGPRKGIQGEEKKGKKKKNLNQSHRDRGGLVKAQRESTSEGFSD